MFNTGHDVGGFFGPVPDAELLVRWTQNGAFSPRFIMNSWKSGGEVNTPWLHPKALPLVRDAIRLRYRLLPYLYSLYREAALHGVPMLRPTFFEFEEDARAFADSDDFMLGPNVLVASVVEPGQRTRRVYLPRGPAGWYDFWTGAWYAAGQEIVAAAPLDRIPLFVPAGGIVAATDTCDFSRLHDEPSRQLRLFPPPGTGTATFALYEDDGRSLAYAKGDFAIVEIEMRTTRRTIELSARKTGRCALPYSSIRVILPPGERRRAALTGKGVDLVAPR
jgi:alpha-glucosidase